MKELIKCPNGDVNIKMFDPKNDSKLSLYLGVDKQTVYRLKREEPEVYEAIKKGWIIKCKNPEYLVDTEFASVLGRANTNRRYELLWLYWDAKITEAIVD